MALIKKIVQTAFWKANKVLILNFLKYLDYINNFLANFIIELLKHNNKNNHTIELLESKQTFYKPIYSLRQVK